MSSLTLTVGRTLAKNGIVKKPVYFVSETTLLGLVQSFLLLDDRVQLLERVGEQGKVAN